MNILIVKNGVIPFKHYGGTERVIWYLGKELVKLGHKITYLVEANSTCDFAKVIVLNPNKDIRSQIPKDIDLVHFHYFPDNYTSIDRPYVITLHGNPNHSNPLDLNTIFISSNHASRFGSQNFVYNGLDWEDYSKVNFQINRKYFHFLGKAAWRVKNVRGAINVIKASPKEKIKILGGRRLNFSMGFRWTLSRRAEFHGMVGGIKKDGLIQGSKGLIFPVRWHEPFGLAIIESMYFGCPVFGTPYGSLPELIHKEVGYLTIEGQEMTEAILNSDQYNARFCHEYARESFHSKKMTEAYLEKYQLVLSGQNLNTSPPKRIELNTIKLLPWNS
ncbi:glycosyltransferase [Membranihabitans marinus]|uniref:glycosyltransferase n=1 Tax=Membranihabitans marinus TaxID=1227546 RepID=UPI001F1F6852|nr:glycosyltransferase [Membranihabitans marinus]